MNFPEINSWMQFFAYLAFIGLQLYIAWQNKGLHHQLNSLTDARVLSAGAEGYERGRNEGTKYEQARVATKLATAKDASARLEEIRGDNAEESREHEGGSFRS